MSDEDRTGAIDLTRSEAEALFNNDPPPFVTFSSYYKYEFAFTGESASVKVTVYVGGDHDDIYRMNVNTDPVAISQTLDELASEYKYVYITRISDNATYSESTDRW